MGGSEGIKAVAVRRLTGVGESTECCIVWTPAWSLDRGSEQEMWLLYLSAFFQNGPFTDFKRPKIFSISFLMVKPVYVLTSNEPYNCENLQFLDPEP